MKPFIATLVGGVHDGQQVAIGADVQHMDMPSKTCDPSIPETTRYRRKLWARMVDEASREIETDTFFVLDSMSDVEATTALLQHVKTRQADPRTPS